MRGRGRPACCTRTPMRDGYEIPLRRGTTVQPLMFDACGGCKDHTTVEPELCLLLTACNAIPSNNGEFVGEPGYASADNNGCSGEQILALRETCDVKCADGWEPKNKSASMTYTCNAFGKDPDKPELECVYSMCRRRPACCGPKFFSGESSATI
jgi:hypothetical protein